MNKDDQQWFDALAGRSTTEGDSPSVIEAASVRRALISRRTQIEHQVNSFNAERFKSVQASLTKAGFLQEKIQKSKKSFVDFIFGRINNNSNTITINQVIVIAAILLVTGLAIRGVYIGSSRDDNLRFRGNESATYVITADTKKTVQQFTSGLSAVNAEYTTEEQSYGKIMIRVKATDQAYEFLRDKGLHGLTVVDGYITVIISPPQGNN
jgi:hypothetical protein